MNTDVSDLLKSMINVKHFLSENKGTLKMTLHYKTLVNKQMILL